MKLAQLLSVIVLFISPLIYESGTFLSRYRKVKSKDARVELKL